MTAADVALARDKAAIKLARETAAQRDQVAALTGAVAEWADRELAGGAPPKEVARRMVIAGRLIAAAARGKTAIL